MAEKTTKEKIVTVFVNLAFVIRYWVIATLFAILIWKTNWIRQQPGVEIRDTVAFFVGGIIFITFLYHFLNYEYAQRKFKYDVKSSKDLLSFNTAMEWQKEFLTKTNNAVYVFYTAHKDLLLDGKYREFQQKLDEPENNDAYVALLSILNFSESVCLGVKQNIMDEEFIKGFFQSVFESQYNRYIGYIEYRRRVKQNVNIWNNFTDLSNKWITCD